MPPATTAAPAAARTTPIATAERVSGVLATPPVGGAGASGAGLLVAALLVAGIGGLWRRSRITATAGGAG